MAEQPKYFEVEDYDTGKRYRVEAYEPDVTYEEAVQYLSDLPDDELSQYEYNPTPVKQQQAAPTPQSAAPVAASAEEPKKKTDVWSNRPDQDAIPTTYSRSIADRPEIVEALETAYRSGKRDVDSLNAIIGSFERSDTIGRLSKADVAGLRQREAYLRAEGTFNSRPLFGTVQERLDVPEPEAPTTVSGALGSSAIKSAQNMANSAIGLSAVASNALGFEGTADELLDLYINKQAAINYDRPDAVGTLENLSWDNAALYGAEAIGELLPQLAGSGLAGLAGKKGGEILAGRAAAKMVADLEAKGITRTAAENMVIQAATQKIVRRSMTAAVTAQSIGQETGNIFGNTYAATGEKATIASIGAGILSGSLDSLLPLRFLDNLGIGREVVRQSFGGAVGRIAIEGGKSFVMEGATEALQEFIAELPTSYITGESPFTSEMLSQMANAFVKGGIGGLAAGGASASTRQNYTGPQTEFLSEREATIEAPKGRVNSKQYNQGLEAARARGQEIVDETVSGWNNRPDVEVLGNFKGTGMDQSALGVYRGNGQIALNMQGILREAKSRGVSPDTVVESVLFHEALGHYGLESLYRDNLDAKLFEFYNQGSPEFRRMVDSWIANNPDAYLDGNGDPDVVRAAEEVMAEIAQEGNIPRSMIDELVNMIKDFMRNIGLEKMSALNYSEREIRTIIAKGQDKVRRGPQLDVITGAPVDKHIYIGQGAKDGEKLRQEISKEIAEDGGTPYSTNTLQMLQSEYAKFERMGLDKDDLYEMFGPDSIGRANDGWFIGPDGKWRLEIADDLTSFNEFLMSMGEDQPLGDVLNHPQLFEAYPQLENLTVTYDDKLGIAEEGVLGYYSPDTNTIYLDENNPFQKSTLLHEIQHAIQLIESFGFGGDTVSAVESLPAATLRKGSENLVQYLEIEAEDLSSQVRLYESVMQLPEAQELRRLYTEWVEALNNPDVPERPGLRDEFAAATAALDNVLIGRPRVETDTASSLPQHYDTIRHAVANSVKAERLLAQAVIAESKYEDMVRALNEDNFELMRSVVKMDSTSAYSAYRHLLGEYEARDVQARERLTPIGRQLSAPLSSEPDIDTDSLIATDVQGLPLSQREPETTSAGFRRRSVDERSAREARRQFWEMKRKASEEGEQWQGESVYPSTAKYARPMKVNKKVEPLTIEELTADDLVNSMNALDLLTRISDNYQKTSLPLDELQREAALRAVPPSAIQKLSVNPGDFTVKMFAYDLAAQKLNDKMAGLYGKIQTGRYTSRDKAEFLKTSAAFEDITAKIFGLQSEYGRVLRALQDMEFTSKRIKTIRDALRNLDNDATGLAGLDDPATFERYARTLIQQQEQTASANSTLGETVLSVINTPRAIMSSYDLSAPLRQGVFFVGRPEYYGAWVTMMQSEADYQAMMRDIISSPNYGLMSVGKLFMSSVDGDIASREESFQTTLAEKIPGVRWSEVKYASFLNKLRSDLFNSFIAEYESNGYELATKVDPKTGERVPKPLEELTDKDTAILRALGSFINAGTGRGNLTLRQSKFLQAAGPVLNALFFSPGLIMSRLRLLNPVWYASLPKPVRQSALQSAGSFAMPLVMILGMAGFLFGEETVEWDPRSSDFLKLKFGDTRYDITGGTAQYMTLFTRAFIHTSNQMGTDWASRKDSVGDLHKYNDKGDFFKNSFLNDFMRTSRYKLSPVGSFVVDFWDGKDAMGEEFTVAGGIASRMIPLYLQDVMEMKDSVSAEKLPQALAMSIPGFFGVGVSKYTPSPLDTEQIIEAPQSFKDKRYENAENDFVKIEDGVVELKAPAERMWERTANAFFQEIMQEQIAHPAWPSLSAKQQAEIITEAKKLARGETKKYMYPLLGMEGSQETEEEVIEE
jgi:hypothetical protein